MPIGYHFTSDTLRDGRPIPAVGEKLVHDGPVELCRSGLHGSDEPFDALQYAPGPLLHRVEYADPIERASDKWVSVERTILATVDATQLLRRFAADQALSVAHLWDMPEVVREYLETLDESMRDDAIQAARGAVSYKYAAMDGAIAAARYAAWSSAWSSAWTAAWTVAWTDASDVAADAAWVAAKADFNARVYAAFDAT